MPDESSDNDQAWWMPADRPDPAEPEDVIEMGPVDATRPIGPMNLRSWSRRPYILAGVAVAALLGGAGAALAATNSPGALRIPERRGGHAGPVPRAVRAAAPGRPDPATTASAAGSGSASAACSGRCTASSSWPSPAVATRPSTCRTARSRP